MSLMFKPRKIMFAYLVLENGHGGIWGGGAVNGGAVLGEAYYRAQ